MQLHDIVVFVESSDAGIARLRCAAKLARRSGSRLTGIGVAAVSPLLPLYTNAEWGVAGIAQLGTAAELDLGEFQGLALPESDSSQISDAERNFRSASEGLIAEWHILEYRAPTALIQLSQLADLLILPQDLPRGESQDWGFHAEDVILASGGPCLVVSYAGTFETIGKHVLIAWDGSVEAARALRASKPLLADATSVTLIGVYPKETESGEVKQALERVASRLKLQGINIRPEPSIQGDLKISDILLNRASDLAIDLLVTGSFHHSRLRQLFVGGVTRELLAHMTVPVLMSH